MARIIPEGAFLFKEGLYIVETNLTLAGMAITKWELYAADGWCFYDLTIPENYDEEGNLVPEAQRVYYQYSIMRKDEQYVTDNIICVPVQDGYEIVSVNNGAVTQ